MTDYTPITPDATPTALLGEWWRLPPHMIRTGTYKPYRGEGLAPVEVTADILVSAGKRAVRYDPNSEAALLGAMLDVAQGRLKPVQFANRFGLLGYNYIVPSENACKGGDPLNWFIAQAQTIQVAGELIERLAEARESDGGRRFLADYLKNEIPNGPYALGGCVTEIQFQQFPRNPILAANGILRYLLNANLGETGRRIQMIGDVARTVFTFRALIEVIYWQLADRIGMSSIIRCVECGRIFTSANARRQHCSVQCKNRRGSRRFRKERKTAVRSRR